MTVKLTAVKEKVIKPDMSPKEWRENKQSPKPCLSPPPLHMTESGEQPPKTRQKHDQSEWEQGNNGSCT